MLRHIALVAFFGAWLLATSPFGNAAEIGSLLSRAITAAESGDHEALTDVLEQALDQARAEAPLSAKPFLLVTRPAEFFGDYEPRGDAVFYRGETHRFYLELRNLVSARDDAGVYELAFVVDLEILDAGGQVVISQEGFTSLELPTRSVIHDLFLNLEVALTGAPSGEYGVRFIIRDGNSDKTLALVHPIMLR